MTTRWLIRATRRAVDDTAGTYTDDGVEEEVETATPFVPVLGLRRLLDMLPVDEHRGYRVEIEKLS